MARAKSDGNQIEGRFFLFGVNEGEFFKYRLIKVIICLNNILKSMLWLSLERYNFICWNEGNFSKNIRTGYTVDSGFNCVIILTWINSWLEF